MDWHFNNERPIYSQLVEGLQFWIVSGKLRPGEKLPSVRDLAAQASVNPNTVQRALVELEQKGLVCTKRTSGRFVSEDESQMIQARERLATETISHFLLDMKKLGCRPEEIVFLVEKYLADFSEKTVNHSQEESGE